MFNKFKNTTNMNRIKQIFSLAIGLSLLVSCVDLDTAPREVPLPPNRNKWWPR